MLALNLIRYNISVAPVAQWTEHLTSDQTVARSNRAEGIFHFPNKNTMLTILTRYSEIPGNRDLVIRSICSLLAECPQAVDWAGFSRQDWEVLKKMVSDEGVAEVDYYFLKADPSTYHFSSFSPDTFQKLAVSEAVTALRNALLFKQLACIVKALAERDITVRLLKGADLAYSLYPEPGLWPMTDLDLLVSREHFESALELVHTLGYNEYLPEASPGLDRLLSHHAHLRKDGPAGILLELHWTLVGTPAFRHAVSMDWFWENLEPNPWWAGKYPADQRQLVFNLNPTANLAGRGKMNPYRRLS